MVTINLKGGRGNQYFQIAATIAYAKRHNIPYHIPDVTSMRGEMRPATVQNLRNKNYNQNTVRKTTVIVETGFHYEPLPFKDEWVSQDGFIIELNGFFQSPKYFEDQLSKADLMVIFDLYGQLRPVTASTVIHFRLGDYMSLQEFHPIITVDYINNAIKELAIPNHAFSPIMVLSDSPSIAETMIKSCSEVVSRGFHVVKNGDDELHFGTMNRAKSLVTSNSTFSWWAAYLNTNSNLKVVCPDPSSWFGPSLASHDTKDLLPLEWIKVKF